VKQKMEQIETTAGKAGKLYGLGVGPGDPELMTLKAVRLIRESHVIAVPLSGQESVTALEIAGGAVPEIREKELLQLSMPMTRDKEKLAESHNKAAAAVIRELVKGKDVAFLTLGDPSIYSTYLYIHAKVTALGFETEIIPGVPSFCAAAARLNEGLAEASEALHIIPASYEGIEEALALKGTRVLMKSGKSIGKVKSLLADMEKPPRVKMVERCGMKGERVFRRLEDLDEEAGYFSILIVRD
jgi:precorrin-2/cobalt-factor-2 C20-methyltransferase